MRGQLGLGTLLPRQAARRRAAAKPDAGGAVPRANAPVVQSTVPQANPYSTARSRMSALGHFDAARNSAAARNNSSGASRSASGSASANTSSRTAALRYAAWNWPITPAPHQPASTDLERVFALWSTYPQAPILAACGVAFDVIEADAAPGRTALIRLDRLGVQLGPVLMAPLGRASARGTARIGFLVRVDTATALSTLIDPRTGPALFGRGEHVELPRSLGQRQPHREAAAPSEPFWLRAPSAARPALPAAHVVLGALTLAPHRTLTALAGSRTGR